MITSHWYSWLHHTVPGMWSLYCLLLQFLHHWPIFIIIIKDIILLYMIVYIRKEKTYCFNRYGSHLYALDTYIMATEFSNTCTYKYIQFPIMLHSIIYQLLHKIFTGQISSQFKWLQNQQYLISVSVSVFQENSHHRVNSLTCTSITNLLTGKYETKMFLFKILTSNLLSAYWKPTYW